MKHKQNLIKSAKARVTGIIPYWLELDLYVHVYIYMCTRVYHNVTISLKKFFITNPLILEEQNSFKIII
jgi:hypothetical protein